MPRPPSLRQLRYFAALADTGHYRRAAERMGISQPSLSLQIANLEETLGLKLVEPGRGAMLTPAGREVLARARGVLDGVAEIMAVSETLLTGMAGTIRLGSSPTLGPYFLPQAVRLIHRRYPDLRLFIRDGAPRDLQAQLLEGEHDLILTHLPVQSAELEVQRLFREPLHLAVARDHPLAAREKVEDADLEGQDVLSLGTAFTLHDQIAELCRELRANLRRDYEGTSLDALRQMTAMNMGVTFLPALYVASEVRGPDPDVAVLPFRAGRMMRSIGLAWRKSSGRQKSYALVAEIAREAAAEAFRGLLRP